MGEIVQINEGSSMILLRLAEAMQPRFDEVRNKEWITYGNKDNYPDYIIDLFNKSAKHAALVKSKVNYICGEGWEVGGKEFDQQVNDSGEMLSDVSKKCVLDVELHGGFFLEVIYTKGGSVQLYHGDYRKYRSNKDNSMFYYHPEGKFFGGSKVKPTAIPAFSANKKSGKSIFYYREYRPGVDTYTLPGYVAANNYIEADIEVSKHTLGNAKCGFTPSTMITLPNGEPSEEQKRVIERKFREKFTGSDGQKFLLSFVNSAEKKPIIDDLGTSDLTKEDFTVIDNLIQQNIFVAHQVTSPMLFGIRVEGQLGGRNEMREAFEIFQNTYISYKQQNIEKVFSFLLGIEGLEIAETEPIEFQFGETIASQNMTSMEIRDSLDVEEVDNKSIDFNMLKTLDDLRVLNKSMFDRVVASMTDDEVRGVIKLPPAPVPDPATDPAQKQPFSNQDLEFINLMGNLKEDCIIVNSKPVNFKTKFEALEYELDIFQGADTVQILTPTEQLIIDYIRKDPKVTPEIIARRSKLNIDQVEKTMNSLAKRNYIQVTVEPTGIGDGEVVSRTPSDGIPTGPSRKEIGIKYSYEINPDKPSLVPGGSSRPFCKKLMELNRLYSRKDIENISERLGYDVWTHKGGWYHNPNTGQNEDECRHQWVSHITIKAK